MDQTTELIENKIRLIRGKKVMFDSDLARLYGVGTKRLNEQVRRNIKRFPEDFMFQLTSEEIEGMRPQIATAYEVTDLNKPNMRSQFVTVSKRNVRFQPYVFTEQGVAMLSSVLKSETAIAVNIQIMRTFTKIREMLISNRELRRKLEDMEKKYDSKFEKVFRVIYKLVSREDEGPKLPIGFDIDN